MGHPEDEALTKLPDEIHGTYPRLRVKWSCIHCTKRNDNSVHNPPVPRQVFVCHACKHATVIKFKVEEQVTEP